MKRNDVHIEESRRGIKRDLLTEFDRIIDWGLESKLDQKLDEWSEKTSLKLKDLNPLRTEFRILKNSKNELASGICSRESTIEDIENYKAVCKNLDDGFWKKKCKGADKKELHVIRSKIIDDWTQELEKQLATTVLKEIEKERNKLVKELEEWLRLIETIKDSVDSLGLEPGYLWDLSSGSLSQQDIETLKKWADAFRNDPNVRKICELLGRMNAKTESKECQTEQVVSYYNTVPDFNSKEEISGIELGNDLENVLPSELVQLNDPDCDILFTLKFVESRLMCFSKQGYREEEEFTIETVTTSEEEKQTGPIILCVDTSGSMHGVPEHIAKAVALYISMSAMGQNRNCFLINFSTGIKTIDLTPPKGISDLLNFMRLSFNGGTDAVPALKKAIETTNEKSYRLADIIMISDFVMPPNAFSGLKNDIELSKMRKCRYHCLIVGGFTHAELSMGDTFDEVWIYDTAKNSVEELRKTTRSLNNPRTFS